jgi:hypothetical protein
MTSIIGFMAISIIQTRTHNYNLYILEQLSSWSTSRIRPSWSRSRLRLSRPLALLLKCIPCLPWPTQHLAVCSNRSGFTLNPFIAIWALLTNVQVNNTAALHDTHGHTYIHHIGITILLLFYTSSTLLGRPAGPDPSRLAQLQILYLFQYVPKTVKI